ncbi:MAG: PD-(D/E)XK nuclease family protein [Deltaproteobacteria bacterium]|nr:PD-(D/E)XK nuclease family protein [Deltaproteobacteria bacterium]
MTLHLFCSPNLRSDLPILLQSVVQKFIAHRLEDSFRIVCPHQAAVESVEMALLKFPDLGGVLTGKSILTLEGFYSELLQENVEIPSASATWVLEHLWNELAQKEQIPQTLSESLFALTQEWRKEGLSSSQLFQFIVPLEQELAQKWKKVFEQYDLLLRQQKTLWDERKFSDQAFKWIVQQKSKVLHRLESLYFIGFPEGNLNFKRILKQLNSSYPKLQILLWLQSGKTHPQDFIAQDWEEFRENYVEIQETKPEPNTAKIKCRAFNTPFEEAGFLLQKIDEALQSGIEASKMLLLIPPSTFWGDYWSEQLGYLGFSTGIKNYKSILNCDTLRQNSGLEIQEAMKLCKEKIREHKAFEIWKESLEALLFYQDQFPSFRFDQINLAQLAQKIFYPLGSANDCGIRLSTWNELGLESYEKVFVFQMNENVFGQKKISLWGKALPLLKNKAFHEERHFQELLSLSEQEIFFSYSILDAQGKAQAPFPLLQDISEAAEVLDSEAAIAYYKPTQNIFEAEKKLAAERKRLFEWKGQHSYSGKILNPEILQQLRKQLIPHIFSATQLEDYAQCPFRFYGKVLLKMKGKEEQEIDPNALDTGRWLHSFLELFFKKFSEDIFAALFSGSKREEIKNLLAQEFSLFSEGFQKEHPYLETQLCKAFEHKAVQTLQELLILYWKNEENAEAPCKPTLFEASFSEEDSLHFENKNNSIRIQGKIDRVDCNVEKGEFAVFDYKTGELSKLNPQIKAYQKIQLPLYALAAKKLLEKKFNKPMQLLASMALNLKDMEFKYGLLPKTNQRRFSQNARSGAIYQDAEWEEFWKNLEIKILEYAEQIKSGNFEIKPDPCLAYCEFREVCRYYDRA